MGMLFHLSGPQFPHFYSTGDVDSSNFITLLWELNEIIYIDHLVPVLSTYQALIKLQPFLKNNLNSSVLKSISSKYALIGRQKVEISSITAYMYTFTSIKDET